jgi:hypothetical protein
MKLEEYKKDSYEFSKSTSDLVRQFSFAGIAIIWIFKIDKPIDHLIPSPLFKPLLFLVFTLSLDLFQYLIPSIIWALFDIMKAKVRIQKPMSKQVYYIVSRDGYFILGRL